MKVAITNILLLACISTVSADPWSAMPSFFSYKAISPNGPGIAFRKSNDVFAYGVQTNFREKSLGFKADKYNAVSFLTNGFGTFANLSVKSKSNQFGAYVFNEGSSYFFMGMVRHRALLGTGYNIETASIYPTFEASITPRLFNLGMELTYKYDKYEGKMTNITEIGFVYLW
jgi:hypothetical protein